MNFNLSASEILNILNSIEKPDLSIPQSKRQSILNNLPLEFYLKSIEKTAAKHRGKAIPSIPYSLFKLYYENGNRNEFQFSEKGGYFPRRERLAAFALSAWLYEKEEDIKELEDIIWAICDEYTWALPPHLIVSDKENSFINRIEHGDYTVDLFSSETSGSLAEIMMLMGDKISPLIKKRVNFLLFERVFNQILNINYWWMTAENNWASVCAGNIGIAAIYTIEDNELLSKIIERLLPSFSAYLKGIPNDGGCLEGIKYWDYGFGYYVYFAELLYRRTNGAIDLFSHPKVERIAEFQHICYLKGGRSVSFADSESHTKYHIGLASFLSRKFENVTIPPKEAAGDFNMDICYRFAANLRDLIWAGNLENAEIYSYYMLPDSQIFVSSSKNGVGLAAKGGHNNEPHNHNDVGSFQIFKNGEELISDIGSIEYTRDGGITELRYKMVGPSSESHNLPIIDGKAELFGESYRANNFEMNQNGVKLDIAAAYELNYMPSLVRKIDFNCENSEIELEDKFIFTDGKHEITERFVTFGDIEINENTIKIKVNNETMVISFDEKYFDAEYKTESYKDIFGIKREINFLDFKTSAEKEFTANFKIYTF